MAEEPNTPNRSPRKPPGGARLLFIGVTVGFVVFWLVYTLIQMVNWK